MLYFQFSFSVASILMVIDGRNDLNRQVMCHKEELFSTFPILAKLVAKLSDLLRPLSHHDVLVLSSFYTYCIYFLNSLSG